MSEDTKLSGPKVHVPVIPYEFILPFCLVTTLFALWGFANDVTNPLVRAFREIFLISNEQSSLVQTAFYGGYATMALPAAIFIRRFSYKAGILVGLALYATGALLFIPASMMMEFWIFLIALYILTFGLAFLETTANPYILAMGPESTATRRLNFAQAFNPMGSLIGMVVASQIVLASLGVQEFRNLHTERINEEHKQQFDENVKEFEGDPEAFKVGITLQEKELEAAEKKLKALEKESEEFKNSEKEVNAARDALNDRRMAALGKYTRILPARMDGIITDLLWSFQGGEITFDVKDDEGKLKFEDHKAMQAHDLRVVRLPYVVIGMVIIGMLLVFAMAKLPAAGGDDRQIHFFVTFGRLLMNGRYVGGVIAQTAYVGAQIMCWTFIIHYAMINLSMSLSQAQLYNTVAMVIFCSSRFICTYLLKYVSAGGLLMCLALGGIATTAGAIFLDGMAGLYSLIGISACMSLMFPTIYGIALDGLGEAAKLGSAGLIFAIVGGALMPRFQAQIIDKGDYAGNLDLGFMTLPAVSFSFILPLACFVVIAIYGLLTHKPRQA